MKAVKLPHLPWSTKAVPQGPCSVDAETLFAEHRVTVLVRQRKKIDMLSSDSPWPGRQGKKLPIGWCIYGEQLPSAFYVFFIRTGEGRCLPWSETVTWAKLLGLAPAPVIFRGFWDEGKVKSAWADYPDGARGYIVRRSSLFSLFVLPKRAAQYIGANHP